MYKKQISQIKIWLSFGRNHYQESNCPFHCKFGAGYICHELFPKTKEFGPMYSHSNRRACGVYTGCPCDYYPIEEVVAKAKEVIDASVQSSREKDATL
jgi:hypothetical protein